MELVIEFTKTEAGIRKLPITEDEMARLEELEAAKKEVEKVVGEKPVSQKMFKAI